MELIEFESIKNSLLKERTYKLLNILNFSQHEYTPAVIPVIKDELLSREVPPQLIEDIENRYQQIMLKNSSPGQRFAAKFKKFFLGEEYEVA
ncbi:hypothetical protein HDF19_17285 [Mucilaginibacter sp. E4BP6]|jgi:hypothetical protein|uniref:hypothetical protein n=1 Tax=Mucilaginibacter sp. E4BP6 TaxID=2723089 RepID=UPI0015CB4200|nr:hypothetical protein [Mucilaginibacter sp. E4BP6]NYE66356.1 hypothetical protein [Mucilaginibacter sp. E4BP6]